MKYDEQYQYEHHGTHCFYCGLSNEAVGLEEHHIYPGYRRKTSPTVWLCHNCHFKCHKDTEFLKKIQFLYEKEYGRKTKEGNNSYITKDSTDEGIFKTISSS